MTDPPQRDEGAPSTEPADEVESARVVEAAGAAGDADLVEPVKAADSSKAAEAAGDAEPAELAELAEVAGAAEDAEPGGEQAEGAAAEVDTAPERRDLLAMLRERRTLVFAIAAVVVVVAVVATLGVTLSGEDDRPVPSGAMPTLGGQFAVAPVATGTSAPGTPATLPQYPGSPLWIVQMPNGVEDYDLPEFAVTDHGYVLQADKEVLGLDRTGKEIWRFTPPEVDYFTVRVTGPQVFVGYANPDDDRWPQPQVVIALDAATGAELWRDAEASLWSVTTDTLYMSVCYGGQNNRIGDCRLSARDPRTNTIRWRIPTYASSSVVNAGENLQAAPTPPYLLVGGYPTGADSFALSGHASATGATLGSGYEGPDGNVGSVSTASERTVVTTDDGDDNPADGCSALLIGFSVSGAAETWRYTARTTKDDDGRRCARQPISGNDGRLGVTSPDGAPSVLNVENGAIEWSAPAKGQAVAASGTTLLTVETAADGNAELVAYRVGDAKPAWRAPFLGEPDTSIVAITDTQVIVTGYAGDAAGYDLKPGKGWSYGGSVAQETDTWFAVCDEISCRGYPIGRFAPAGAECPNAHRSRGQPALRQRTDRRRPDPPARHRRRG